MQDKIKSFFKKEKRIVIDPRHYYRWNYRFGMWTHTGIIHFKEVP